MAPLPDSFRNILVCQLRQIGDVLLATPALELLARRFPQARLSVVTEKKCAPVLAHNPHVHQVFLLDKAAMGGLAGQLATYWRIARHGFDLVVDFQQLPRTRYISAMTRAPVRLSFVSNWYQRAFYTHLVRPKDGYSAMSKASILDPLGIRWQGERPRLYLTPEEQAWAHGYLAALGITSAHRLVTVDPSHRRDTRRWPATEFGRTLALAAAVDAQLRFLVLYGPGEVADAQAVATAANRPDVVHVPEKLLTLREMAAVMATARLHCGNCSAPRHFAVAVDTPSLTVLGSTSDAWTYPSPRHVHLALGLDCQPCNRNTCPHGHVRCLRELRPELVAPRLVAMAAGEMGA